MAEEGGGPLGKRKSYSIHQQCLCLCLQLKG